MGRALVPLLAGLMLLSASADKRLIAWTVEDATESGEARLSLQREHTLPDDAIAAGEMKQQDLVDRVTRSFTLLMAAGLFDPLEQLRHGHARRAALQRDGGAVAADGRHGHLLAGGQRAGTPHRRHARLRRADLPAAGPRAARAVVPHGPPLSCGGGLLLRAR